MEKSEISACLKADDIYVIQKDNLCFLHLVRRNPRYGKGPWEPRELAPVRITIDSMFKDFENRAAVIDRAATVCHASMGHVADEPSVWRTLAKSLKPSSRIYVVWDIGGQTTPKLADLGLIVDRCFLVVTNDTAIQGVYHFDTYCGPKESRMCRVVYEMTTDEIAKELTE